MPFPPNEKNVLLAVKGVGPTVIARLEQLGYSSLATLAQADTAHIVAGAAAIVGSTCWKNSPQANAAIRAAISAAQRHVAPVTRDLQVKPSRPVSHRTFSSDAGPMNLGPKSIQRLQAAGICTIAQLRDLGAPAAYVRVKRTGAPVSLNLLWAMEGALSGMTWQEVARRHRTSLLLAVEQLEKGG